MDNKQRIYKEQILRGNKISKDERNLMNRYMQLMHREKEGTIKQEIYNIFKDEQEIIDIINMKNQCV